MKFNPKLVAFLLMVVIIIVALIIPLPSLGRFMDSAPERDEDAVTTAIESALVQCYALEGAYPPNLEYLASHYGLRLDRENYFYHYEVYTANLRPNVYVFRITE